MPGLRPLPKTQTNPARSPQPPNRSDLSKRFGGFYPLAPSSFSQKSKQIGSIHPISCLFYLKNRVQFFRDSHACLFFDSSHINVPPRLSRLPSFPSPAPAAPNLAPPRAIPDCRPGPRRHGPHHRRGSRGRKGARLPGDPGTLGHAPPVFFFAAAAGGSPPFGDR